MNLRNQKQKKIILVFIFLVIFLIIFFGNYLKKNKNLIPTFTYKNISIYKKNYSEKNKNQIIKLDGKKLIEYLFLKKSDFENLEKQRTQFLNVENIKKKKNIWLHRKEKQNGSQGNGSDVEFENGIIDQLNFVPENYKKRVEELGLKDFFHEKFNKEENEKLEKHLRSEFNEVDNYVKELQNLENFLKKKKNESLEKEKYEKKLDKGKLFPNWNNLLRIIFKEDMEKKERESFEELKCPVSSCFLTNQPNLKPFSHLVIFKKFNQIHKLKRNQISLFMSLESPIHSFTSNDFKYPEVNWTASYRWDSTIVTPYDKFLFDPSQATYNQTKDFSRNKTHLVAWLVSNCNPSNDRKKIVKKIQKHLSVDVYGWCGSLKCKNKTICLDLLKNYKFYLAFENSNCDHYITEKLFRNALKNNVVPVVYGARKSDYLKIAPPSSFIHYEDFNSTELLASYLLKLDKNSTLYNKYFEWKKKGRFMETDYLCRICSLLQDDEKPIMWYSNVGSWWFNQGSCSRSPWIERKNDH